ncbi:hypothetical protein K438DRAFT_1767440 [Mycena galopus ATCC 62051]|nr:hypothetical protein K438DRAFT_1767440 [Mycena galopus ATCC 62051]
MYSTLHTALLPAHIERPVASILETPAEDLDYFLALQYAFERNVPEDPELGGIFEVSIGSLRKPGDGPQFRAAEWAQSAKKREESGGGWAGRESKGVGRGACEDTVAACSDEGRRTCWVRETWLASSPFNM